LLDFISVVLYKYLPAGDSTSVIALADNDILERQRHMAIDQSKIDRVVELARSYGATRLILFGSMVKTPSAARDIDIACDGVPGWKLYELAAKIEDELEVPLDIIPLRPATRLTMKIENEGKTLI